MKIFDCFTFFNEVELLELRLKMLSPYVDYFILVESNVTFRGDLKPFYFNPTDERFKPYINKIIHMKFGNFSQETKPNDYSLEIQQRNYISAGLNRLNICQDNDLIIISDLDEIPNPAILQQLKNNTLFSKGNLLKLHRVFRKRKHKLPAYLRYIQLLIKYSQNASIIDILNITPLGFSQKHFYYYMNNLYTDKWWGSVISFYKNMKTPQSLRDVRRHLPVLNNGGYHFSYMGGIDRIIKKQNSIVDEDPSHKKNKIYNSSYVKKCLENGSRIATNQATQNHVFTKISISDIGIDGLDKFAQKYPYMFLK